MELRLVWLVVTLISLQSICFADHLIELIEKAALALPIESYENDPFALVQIYKIGKGKHNYTNYYWPKENGSGPAVFKTRRNDIGKEVVVLHAGEDRLRVTLLKKTYVVLIQDKDSKKTYWPLYAYARGKDAIEWDVWEPQRMKESKAFALGWDSCSSSIYTPCKPELEGKEKNDPPGYTKDIWERTKLDLHIASRLSKYDYFVDLEDTSIERKQIGRTLKFLLSHTEAGLSLTQLIKTIDEKPETHPSSVESGENHGKDGKTARGKYDEDINKYYKDLRTGKSKGHSGQGEPVTQEKWNSLGLPASAGLEKTNSGSANSTGQDGQSTSPSDQSGRGLRMGKRGRGLHMGKRGRGLLGGLFGGGGGGNGGKPKGKYDEEIDNYMKDFKAGKITGNSGQPVTQAKWQALGLPASAGLPTKQEQQVPPSEGGGAAWASSFGQGNGNQGGRAIAASTGEKPGAKIARSTDTETKIGVQSAKMETENSVGSSSSSLVEAEAEGSAGIRDGRATPANANAKSKGRGLLGGLFGGGNNNGGKPKGKYDEEINNYFKDLKAGKVTGNSGQPVTQEKWTALGLPASAGIAKPEPQPAQGEGGGGAAWASSFGQNSDQAGRSITQSRDVPVGEHQDGRGLLGGLFGGGGGNNNGGKPRGKYDEEIDNYFKDLKAGKVTGNSGKPVTQEKWTALGLPASAGITRAEPQPSQGGGGAAWSNSFGQGNADQAGRGLHMGKRGRGLLGGLFGGGGQNGGGKPRGKYDEEIDNYMKDLKAGKVTGNSGQPVTQAKWQALGLPASAGLPRPDSQPAQGGGGAAWSNSFGQNADQGGRSITQSQDVPVGEHQDGRGLLGGLFGGGGGNNGGKPKGKYDEEIDNYFKDLKAGKVTGNSGQPVTQAKWQALGLPASAGLPRADSQPAQGGGGAAWSNSFGQNSGNPGMGRSISKTAGPRRQGQDDEDSIRRQTEYQFHRHHLPTSSEEEIFNYFRAQSERQGSVEMRTSSEEVLSNEWENRGLPRIPSYGQHGQTYSGFSGSRWTANWKTFTGSITGQGRIPFSGFKHHPHIHVHGSDYRPRRPIYYSDERRHTSSLGYNTNPRRDSEERYKAYSTPQPSTTEVPEPTTNPPNTKGRFNGQDSDETPKGSEEKGRFGGQNSDEISTSTGNPRSEDDQSTERSKKPKQDRQRSEESEEPSNDKKSRQKVSQNSPENESSESSTIESSDERSGESDERNIYEIEREVITRQPESVEQSTEKYEDSREQGSQENSSGERTRNRNRDSSDQSDESETVRIRVDLDDDSSEESSEEDEGCSNEDLKSSEITASFETARIDRKREPYVSKESRERERPLAPAPVKHEKPHQENNGITITQSSGPIITYHPMVSFPILPNAQHPILSDPHTVAAAEAGLRFGFGGRGLQLPSTTNQTKSTHDPSGNIALNHPMSANIQSVVDAMRSQIKGPSAAPLGRSAGTLRQKTSDAPSSISVAEHGRSIHEITNFLASHENDLDLFGRSGWKTQDINSTDELKHFSIDQEHDPFAGFGNCPYENLTLERYVASNSTAIENQIMDYLIPLRAQCNKPLVDTLVKLFKESVLTTETLSDGGKYEFFKILPNWKVLTKPKLTLTEKNELNIAYEFFWFTRTLLWQLDQMKGKLFYTLQDQLKDSYPVTGKEVKKSPHIVFRLYTALFMFDQIFSSIPTHAIALSRNLILTMKTTLMKSLQDYERLESCEACDKGQLDIVHNDLISLIAFPEFISHLISSDSREHGPKALVQKFSTYLIDNEKDLKESLEDYIV